MPKVEKTKRPVKAMKTARKGGKAASRKLKTTRNLMGKAPVGTTNQLVSIEVRNVDSQLIRDLTYSNGDLTINFRSGGLYRYPRVDSRLVMELLAAPSFGKFFTENLKSLPCDRLA